MSNAPENMDGSTMDVHILPDAAEPLEAHTASLRSGSPVVNFETRDEAGRVVVIAQAYNDAYTDADRAALLDGVLSKFGYQRNGEVSYFPQSAEDRTPGSPWEVTCSATHVNPDPNPIELYHPLFGFSSPRGLN